MKNETNIVGGPLDGGIYYGELNIDKPYIVFPGYIEEELEVLCLYYYDGDNLVYLRSRTKEDLMNDPSNC